MNEPKPALSIGRVLLVVVPVAAVLIGVWMWSKKHEQTARSAMYANVYAQILTTNATLAPMKFPDEDGDLVADSPDDPSQCITPEVLTFSFVAGETESVPREAWDQVIERLSAKTGHKVEYMHYASTEEELDALRKGSLHISGLNTGTVPVAVQTAGFVPLCTFGREDGSHYYTMRVIVPADSQIKSLKDLGGHKIMFARPDSNSGCKVLLVLLKDEEGMQPERDYIWGFSGGHEESILGVAEKQYEAAPVASDIMDRMVRKGDLNPNAIRTIYESEHFPPATLGYVYNLAPELRNAIREALIGFELKGTGLDGQFGEDATKLVPVDYKNDWATARRIDQLALHAKRGR